jgi:hypothetical protein
MQRPELFVYLPGSGRDSRPPPLAPGLSIQESARVRVLRAPRRHAIGEIISLPSRPRRLGSGIRAQGAVVVLDSGGTVFVPLENLEIIR